ncbi:YceI family protein [Shewanella algidipiscicola]|uniref:Lipid/polyisoprenoid-binding YceI-like domain-containing protein n=1 Tax=Shewanella algidipiscicola TaxID=614070 RepID=A0ABQ4P661_9GAMM|nr:YceI family protein [Shewanella algidipiscicola]GIU42961.1 hypothetical protein TUM4630_05170 [Shewanella algidipiscicola]
MKTVLLGIWAAVMSLSVFASNWQVNNQDSVVNFMSFKNGDIAEIHKFTQITGELAANGDFSLSIPLTSVWTNIDIRDERMKQVLFETAQFPTLSLTAAIDAQTVDKLAVGSMDTMAIPAKVMLHGQSKALDITVRVAKLNQNTLLVTSEMPLIINAADFDLAAGVEKLRELAGLSAISQAVPVSFVLTLNR